MLAALPTTSVAETLAAGIATLKPGALPAVTTRKCEDLLIDIVGLCITARHAETSERSGDEVAQRGDVDAHGGIGHGEAAKVSMDGRIIANGRIGRP